GGAWRGAGEAPGGGWGPEILLVVKQGVPPPKPAVTVLGPPTAASLLLVRAIETAPKLGSGAGVVPVARPVERVPPMTVAGSTARSKRAGGVVGEMKGLTVIAAARHSPPKLAGGVTGVGG